MKKLNSLIYVTPGILKAIGLYRKDQGFNIIYMWDGSNSYDRMLLMNFLSSDSRRLIVDDSIDIFKANLINEEYPFR